MAWIVRTPTIMDFELDDVIIATAEYFPSWDQYKVEFLPTGEKTTVVNKTPSMMLVVQEWIKERGELYEKHVEFYKSNCRSQQ